MGAACSCLLACGQFDAFWTQATANLSRAEVHLIFLKHAIPQLHETTVSEISQQHISISLWAEVLSLFGETRDSVSAASVASQKNLKQPPRYIHEGPARRFHHTFWCSPGRACDLFRRRGMLRELRNCSWQSCWLMITDSLSLSVAAGRFSNAGDKPSLAMVRF